MHRVRTWLAPVSGGPGPGVLAIGTRLDPVLRPRSSHRSPRRRRKGASDDDASTSSSGMDVCRVRAGMAVPDPQTSIVGRVRRRAGIADALPHPVLCRGVCGHAHHYHGNAVSPVLRLALRTNRRPAQAARSSTPSGIRTPPGKPPKNSPPSNKHTPTSPTTSPPTKPNSDEPPPAKRPSPPSRRHRRGHAANQRSSPAARHRRSDWAKNCFTQSRDGPAEPGRGRTRYSRSGPRARAHASTALSGSANSARRQRPYELQDLVKTPVINQMSIHWSNVCYRGAPSSGSSRTGP